MLHVPTIKPLDTETILREAGKSGRLVVVAETTLSSAVSERLSPAF